jgi:hypothetical protein
MELVSQVQLTANFYIFHICEFLACMGLQMQFELPLTREDFATLRTLMLTLFTRLILTRSCVFLERSLGSKPHVACFTLVLLMTLK